MIRRPLLIVPCLGLGLAACMPVPPGSDLVLGAVGRAVASKVSDKLAPAQATLAQNAAPAATTQPVLDFDVPADALKAKDPELTMLLQKAGQVAAKYNVPVQLVSNSQDSAYLMEEINRLSQPAVIYRLGEYPRITIQLSQPMPLTQGGAP